MSGHPGPVCCSTAEHMCNAAAASAKRRAWQATASCPFFSGGAASQAVHKERNRPGQIVSHTLEGRGSIRASCASSAATSAAMSRSTSCLVSVLSRPPAAGSGTTNAADGRGRPRCNTWENKSVQLVNLGFVSVSDISAARGCNLRIDKVGLEQADEAHLSRPDARPAIIQEQAENAWSPTASSEDALQLRSLWKPPSMGNVAQLKLVLRAGCSVDLASTHGMHTFQEIPAYLAVNCCTFIGSSANTTTACAGNRWG